MISIFNRSLLVLFFAGCCQMVQAQFETPPSHTDLARLEARIMDLEGQLKKKQDKADPRKGFTRVIDGRFYFDSYNVMDQSGADAGAPERLANLKNWNGFRDARIGVKGEGFGILDYKADICFIEGTGSTGNNSGVNFKDVWLGVKNVPCFEYVRIGHFRVEDGLSNMTGGINTTFMEFEGRDFALVRRIGISSRQLWMRDRLRFFTALFCENDIAANKRWSQQDNQGTIVNFRLNYMPYISRGADGKINGKQFVMFGGNYSYVDVTRTAGGANAGASTVRFRSRFGKLNIGDVYDVYIDSSNYHKFGLEFAAQNGPLTFQAEAFANVYDNAAVGTSAANAFAGTVRKDRTVTGAYLEVRYFLTGDYRKFSAENATWGAVDLRHNLDFRKVNDRNFAQSLGGWELAAKWSYTDMSKLSIPNGPACGSVNDLTIGLNWYWSAQARWMFHYSHVMPSRMREGAGRDHSSTDIFATSFRFHF